MNRKVAMSNTQLRAWINTPEFQERFNRDNLHQVSYVALTELISVMQMTAAPKRLSHMQVSNFSDMIQTDVYTALSNERGLFLFGRVGGGKSSLAVAVMREIKQHAAIRLLNNLWEQRETHGWGPEITWGEAERYIGSAFTAAISMTDMRFKNTAELMDDIKTCFDVDAVQSKQSLVEEYAVIDVLVLDDLGMEKPSAFVRETFDMIINRRWLEEKQTIVTSNLNLTQLEAHYDDHGRIASRIAGMCDVIELVGDDRRISK